MITRQLIVSLKFAHGAYNTIMMILFMWQGYLGFTIRKERRSGTQNFGAVRRHRTTGPALAVLGVTGFFAGAALAYIDYGGLLRYPLHLVTGIILVVSILTTFFMSRKIKGRDSAWRTPHFLLGLVILFLYVVQSLLGVGILF